PAARHNRYPDQGSSDARHGQEKSGSDDSRSAGTAPTAPSCARSPAHPWPTSGPGSSTPIAPQRTACRSAAPRAHAPGHTPLAAGGPARSPVFCGDFLHHLDLEIALGHQLLQPGVLRLELPQAPDVARLQAPETLAPSVDRLLADPCRLATAETGSRSASRMIATICSSVNRPLRIAPSESGASLSRNPWSEIPGAGHAKRRHLEKTIHKYKLGSPH